MEILLTALVCLPVGVVLGIVLTRFLFGMAVKQDEDEEPDLTSNNSLYALVAEFDEFYQSTAHPGDIEGHETFRKGVELLKGDDYTPEKLLSYLHGDSGLIACMCMTALAERNETMDKIVDPVVSGLGRVAPWVRLFAIRFLDRHADGSVVANLLSRIDVDDWSHAISADLLWDFVERRVANEVDVTFDASRPMPDGETQSWVISKLESFENPPVELLRAYRAWLSAHVDKGLLQKVGRIWEADPDDEPIFADDDFTANVDAIHDALIKNGRRSVMLLGDDGVGKTTLLKALAQRLMADGWMIFEAGATDIVSGQTYIGELEARLQELTHCLADKAQVLWIVPDLPELAWAGRHRFSQTSVLDHFMPYIASGRVQMIARIPRDAQERLLLGQPKLRSAVDSIAIERLGKDETLTLAQRWSAHHSPADGQPLVDDAVLAEAHELAVQYLGDRAAPGNLLELLKITRRSHAAATEATQLTLDDVVATLSQLTGLPLSMLDDRAELDVDGLRTHFHKHVMGQPEAVDCLVERVALIKAGLTDPTRPQGVFLFAGPTGTGKTEIAKTLAAFLFGSPERMIRLDMSEFQDFDSLPRILGESEEGSAHRQSLVNQIRRQPFSVVLLDEFEKAQSSVWDLFLQLFDDGRLTDRQGRTANFRHAIVIMTTNAGSRELMGTQLGFGAVAGDGALPQALTAIFRPEFLNRIDRLVVFHPLSRSVMRRILRKELCLVLQRRGLRNRQWAVEWDESALDFLLEKGFSSDMGARPLKRAIERYLLSPLALTIVHRQAPEGDQFLFVRTDGERIDVEFVDPDAPQKDAAERQDSDKELRVGTIITDGAGRPEEVVFLQKLYEEFSTSVTNETWKTKKRAALEAMSEPEFWTTEDRFATLAMAENMDRLESGFDTAGRLLNRLGGTGGDTRNGYPSDLVRRLARQLYLLSEGLQSLRDRVPWEALLRVELIDEDADAPARAFADRVIEMYRAWGKGHRMQVDLLSEDRDAGRCTMAVSGYGALGMLRPETGMHVSESEPGRNATRHRVRVIVAPDASTGQEKRRDRVRHAEQTLDAVNVESAKIVRRYREGASPLVRDSVRGWRTGRLDRVFAGGFDLL